MSTTATLNPHAVPFFPTTCSRNNRISQAHAACIDNKATGFRLLDLPDEVLQRPIFPLPRTPACRSPLFACAAAGESVHASV